MGGGTTISTSETRAEALKLQSSSYGAAVPVVHGKTRIAGNLLDYGLFKAVAHTTSEEVGGKGGGTSLENTTYTYRATVVIGLCEGQIQSIGSVWAGKVKYASLNDVPSFTRDWRSGLVWAQPSWWPLALMGVAHEVPYSGMALIGIQDYELGSGADLPNHNFEVVARGAYQAHAELPDADASLIVSDWVTDKRMGLGLPASVLGDLAPLSEWSRASGLMFSPALTEQAPGADRINQLCELAHVAVVPADGKLNFVPLATEAVSRTVGTTTFSYTPDLTPLFELTADQMLADVDEARIEVTRKTPADVYNIVKVEFRNRNNEYALDVAVAEDRANVDVYGAKPAQTIKADWIHDHRTAQTFARMKLQRYLTYLRTYRFKLPWNFAEILPTTLLVISDEEQGVEQALVRVDEMHETEDGWELTCTDCPAVQSAAPIYTLPAPIGFTHSYSALPGDTVVKALFEAPYQLAGGGLEVWAAVEGGEHWGGAHVWVSLDNVSFKKVGTAFGASRSGRLSAAISGGVLAIDQVTGKVLSGSSADAEAKATLCYIGGANPEYLSYTSATLTAEGAYSLSGLVRGQYGTTDASAHADEDIWVRCDEALATSGQLDLALIGQTVWVKFQSFNIHQLQPQDLADVTAVSYVITGKFARPTTDPLNLLVEGSFERLALGQVPERWSDGQVVSISGQPFSRALSFSSGPVTVPGDPVTVRPGDVLWFGGYGDADETSETNIQARARFFSVDGADLGTAALAVFEWGAYIVSRPRAVYGWIYRSGSVTAPANAARAVLEFGRIGTPVAALQPLRLAELVLKRQAATVDIQSQAATGVYSTYIADPVTVTGTEMETLGGSGSPDGQLIASLSVTTTVPCTVILTVLAEISVGLPTSGVSSGGGSCSMSVISAGFPAPGFSNRQGFGHAAAGQTQVALVQISDIQSFKVGTWDLQLKASRTWTDVTASIKKIRFRVEVIKL